PQHYRPQGALGYIVRRLHALHLGKGPQRGPPLPQLAAQPGGLAVRALLPTPQQPPQPGLERDQPQAQLVTVQLPRLKPVPPHEQPLDFREAPAADRLRRPTAVHQPLEVPFEVYRPNTIVELRVTLVVPFVSTARRLIRRPRPTSAS